MELEKERIKNSLTYHHTLLGATTRSINSSCQTSINLPFESNIKMLSGNLKC